VLFANYVNKVSSRLINDAQCDEQLIYFNRALSDRKAWALECEIMNE
jgi:hypothetical protein